MRLVIDDSIPRSVYDELVAAGELAMPPGGERLYLPDLTERDTPDAEWLGRYAGPKSAVVMLDCRDHRAPYLLELCRELEIGLFMFSIPNNRLRLRRLGPWIAREWPSMLALTDEMPAPFGYQYFRSHEVGDPRPISPW